MSYTPFVPLRIFSGFTMLEGAIEPKDITKYAKKQGFPAAAICDRNGLYGVMTFSDSAKKDGVQPIMATFLAVARPLRGGEKGGQELVIDWIALYAQDETGYNNLCTLVSHAHLDRPLDQPPHVPMEILEKYTDGLIALTGAGEGALVRLLAAEQQEEAEAYLDKLQTLFPDHLYIELARRDDPIEEAAEEGLITLAYAHGIPLVATNPSCFLEADFHPAHDAMLCIAASAYVDSQERRHSSPHAWIKSGAEMERLFEDIPEAIQNTLVVAQRCAFAAPVRKPILPSLAGDREGETLMLRKDAWAGLESRLAAMPRPVNRALYEERLKYELNIIENMGFPGYFLIVADFIKWAKANQIPVGPGRGSGAGSVVAWALTITNLDPLQLGLLFERFLNPERVSMPDFDIDFCETRRSEVISYVQHKYGLDHVAQIITFGRMKARAVLKDTGRVLQMSYGQVDRLAKLVPSQVSDPWTLDRALKGVPEITKAYDTEEEVRRLFDLAMKLEGLPRHSSTHAAGVVIGDRPLHQLVPLYRDPRSDFPVTQFDMKYVEKTGLVKFDFLGLKTLSVLNKALQMLKQRGIEVDLDHIPLDDEAVFELLKQGDTVGVFQLESEGMRRTLAAVKPTRFEDIIALVALYRPGPMDNIPSFGARKNGEEEIEYPHPLLEPVLNETYGIIVYQEQVMQAAQVLAGYSLGEADLLRRAMGKKIQAEMDAQRSRFVEGTKQHNIGEKQANELFDLIDKFAGYGFNKSHAAAYALVAYQTAWLKAHYRAEFYAAAMCFDMTLTDKLQIFVDDMRRSGLRYLGPDINHSQSGFIVEEGCVRYALGALKGVGEKAMDDICRERDLNGPFKNLDDFVNRINPAHLNRRQLESLASAGAFDSLNIERCAVHRSSEMIIAMAANISRMRDSGQGGLFGAAEMAMPSIQLPDDKVWTLAERMTAEKEAFGFFFSSHPLDHYHSLLSAMRIRSRTDINRMIPPADNSRIPTQMGAMIEEIRWRNSARGRRYMMIAASDASGQFLASCFDDTAAESLEKAAKDNACVIMQVELDWRSGDETPRISVRSIQFCEALTASVRLRMKIETGEPETVKALSDLIKPHHGGHGELYITALLPLPQGGRAEVLIGRDYILDAELKARIERLSGVQAVHFGSTFEEKQTA
ncbi:MAG: DNA polymerase III subunit alpha [Zymomonas mobilis subsp. pomaceae]|uniref:DNA polymerase III subunit alpha n=1 Tax=Zymomonas mobilis TaxID=542 RepID=UPI0039EA726F